MASLLCSTLHGPQPILLNVLQIVQGVNRGAQANWPNEWAENGTLADITFLELFPVVVAISIWGLHLRNKKLTFNIQNLLYISLIESRQIS